MEIICITVSVNYSDILKHSLNANAAFFKKWFIVTTAEDTATHALIAKVNLSNVEILLFDQLYLDGASFNKGGAVRFAQNHVYKHFPSSNILILDSDILLPEKFRESLPITLKEDTLYGVLERLDYWTESDFLERRNPHTYKLGNKLVGFFQLYKDSGTNKLYKPSINCSICDDEFKDSFLRKKHLYISVSHFGKEEENWNGRKANRL
jgi:hypothetical protein